MAHRINAPLTTLLLAAALTVVGCSRSADTTPPNDRGSRASANATPPALPAMPPGDEEGSDAPATTAITGPVSFADAEATYHAKNYAHAMRLFEHYTAERPDNAWGHFMLGLSSWKAGDLPKAEGAFEKALSIDPNHVKSLVNLSRVFLDQNKVDEAVGKLTYAGGIEPESGEVHRLMARAYHAQGNVDGATEAYRRAIELDEHDAWAMNNLGLLFLEQKRAAEAVPLLAKAVELRKDMPAFHNNLGMALEHTGRFAAAAAAYTGALSVDPDYDKAQKNLVRVQAVKHDHEVQ